MYCVRDSKTDKDKVSCKGVILNQNKELANIEKFKEILFEK